MLKWEDREIKKKMPTNPAERSAGPAQPAPGQEPGTMVGPRVRQVVAETLAALPAPGLVKRLQAIARDDKGELRVRQTAAWTLGRTGRKDAAPVLLALLASNNEDLRRVVAGALTELTGEAH